MKAYGIRSKCKLTIHPHDVCDICSNDQHKVIKKTARRQAKREILEQLQGSAG